jgi:hypothetical protein
VAVVGSFVVLEYSAVTRRSFPTLSDVLVAWTRPHGPIPPVLFMAGWTWLVHHVAVYQPRPTDDVPLCGGCSSPLCPDHLVGKP